MIYYYKVPKKEIYTSELDSEGNIIGQRLLETVPDIPDGISFIGQPVGNNFFIKVGQELEGEGITKLNNIPDQLLKCKVRGVK